MEEYREVLDECRRLALELRREMAGARRDIDALARMLAMGFEDAATKDDIATLSVEIEERKGRSR
jgi:hypothetical protein